MMDNNCVMRVTVNYGQVMAEPMPPEKLSEVDRQKMIQKMRSTARIIVVWFLIFVLVSTLWWLFYSHKHYADIMLTLFILIWCVVGSIAILMVADEAT